MSALANRWQDYFTLRVPGVICDLIVAPSTFKEPEKIRVGQIITFENLTLQEGRWLTDRAYLQLSQGKVQVITVPIRSEEKINQTAQAVLQPSPRRPVTRSQTHHSHTRTRSCSFEAKKNGFPHRPSSPPVGGQ